jgi:hypothetical protein
MTENSKTDAQAEQAFGEIIFRAGRAALEEAGE